MPTSAFVVTAIDSISSDLIVCNSGVCSGNFVSGNITTNSISTTGNVAAGSVTANSATIAGAATVGSINTNSIAVAGAATAGSLNTNSIAVSAGVIADSVSVNTGSFAVGLTSGSVTANTGSFNTSLTISGVPVAKANVPPIRLYLSLSPVTITNMSSTLNFFTNAADRVQLADLTNMSEVRFLATQLVAGASSARMRLNYASSFQTTVTSYNSVLSTAGTNGGVELNLSTGNSIHDSGWLSLRPEAKTSPLYLAVVISGGDGAADPSFGAIIAEFR